MISKLLHKFLWKKHIPWADVIIDSKGAIIVKDYNEAFIELQRVNLGEAAHEKTPEEIVNTYCGRENSKREPPRLEVIHEGIMPDGRIQMELDWNKSFIDHLKENGITGESDEEMIQAYLSLLSTEVETGVAAQFRDQPEVVGEFMRDLQDIEDQTARELDVARRAINKQRQQAERIARQAKKKKKV